MSWRNIYLHQKAVKLDASTDGSTMEFKLLHPGFPMTNPKIPALFLVKFLDNADLLEKFWKYKNTNSFDFWTGSTCLHTCSRRLSTAPAASYIACL